MATLDICVLIIFLFRSIRNTSFCRGNISPFGFQQEKILLRKLLYTNAARVPQSNDSDLWKSSFLAPLFPREKTVEFKGKLLKIISGEGVREYVKAISHVQYVDSDLLLLRTDRQTPNGN